METNKTTSRHRSAGIDTLFATEIADIRNTWQSTRSLVSAGSTIARCGRAKIEITGHASRIPRGNLTINRAAVTTANKTTSALKSASIAGYRYAVYDSAEITASPHLKPENRSAFSNTEFRLGGLRGLRAFTVLPCIARAWVAARRPRCNYGIEILSGERASELESTRGTRLLTNCQPT